MTGQATHDLSIAVPACWKAVLGDVDALERARIVHPRCDARAQEVALAVALMLAERGPVRLISSQDSKRRVEHRAREWLKLAGGEVGHGLASVGDRRVWLDDAVESGPLAAVVVADAHRIVERPSELDDAACWVVVGEPVGQGHWARALSPVARLEAADVLACFPDQGRALQDEAARDVAEAEEHRPPFARFARERLRVRTDKTREFLSPAQQEQAREQLGEGWWTGRRGTPVVSLELSRMQKRYLAAKRAALAAGKQARFLLLKYRRGGFTTLEQALSYRECVESPNTSCITLAHTGDSTKRIFKIAETFLKRDPVKQKRANDSRVNIELVNGSSFFIGTAGSSGVGRGDTLRRVHGSEVSKWMASSSTQLSDVDDLVAGLVGAASHGEVVLETTPNGVEWFCSTYRDAKRGLNDWTPIFLPWFVDPTNRAPTGTYSAEEIAATLTDEEKALVAKHALDPSQVAFRRQKKREYGRLFAQEYPEDEDTCFITSGICYFNVEAITTLLDRGLQKPVMVKELRGYREVRWEERQPGVEYVIGCDTSEGIPGCDPNGIGVLRRDTGAQVASVHGYLSPPALAKVAADFSLEYNGALLGVERENHGHAVLLELRRLGFDRPHFLGGPLYYFHRGSDLASSRPGWDTNSVTRDQMLSDLASAIEESAGLGRTQWVRDPELLSECLAFRLQPSGKFAADPGAHDDSVMKWAVALQMKHHRQPRPMVTSV